MECPEVNQPTGTRNVLKSDVVKEFRLGFFATRRLVSFPWTFLEEDLDSSKSTDLISDILTETCLHSLCRTFPPSARYRRQFLSELIRRLEATTCDPLDQLYDALAEVLAAEEATEGYKNYFLPGGGAVSLLENVALISEGTTGLVTWEAALYLAEWALDHPQTFSGRTVLELGSGVGLTGITICHTCAPSRFVFSDCHGGVLRKLRHNVRLNHLLQRTSPAVSVEELDWTTVTEEQLQQIDADTVIAADVVFDPDLVGGLVRLLSEVLRRPAAVPPEVLICSTVRNPDTYGSFKQQLGAAGIGHQLVRGPVTHVFPYSRSSSTELLRLFVTST